MKSEPLNIVLDNDLDETRKQGNKTLVFRSGNLLEGIAPKENETDTRIKHPFAVTITKDANMNTESVEITWVSTEPDNADTIEIQIKNLYNF